MTEALMRGLIAAVADTIAANAGLLTELDSAIGDGDHGANMTRGFEAVRADADQIAPKPLAEALKAVGTKLVMTVGGASGPLFGTLFLGLGKSLGETVDRDALVAALGDAIDAVAARGKSAAGHKTMLDVLVPVHEALARGRPLGALPGVADTAAAATVPMQAVRGRASFLGPRSVGHMDPGAKSTALIVSAVTKVLENAK